jgi:hypothetical protein
MAKPKTYFVRVKPYNKRRGYLVRNFMHRGVRFTNRWKEVSAAVAQELETLTQPHELVDEIPLFDIKTQTEALAVEEKERDNGIAPKRIARVKDAERVPDRRFRDDRPQFDEESGEIVDDHVEAGEAVEEPAPAPRIRKKTKTRTRSKRKT